MQQELRQRCVEYAAHFAAVAGVDVRVWDTADTVAVYSSACPHFCETCTCSTCNEGYTHLYGSNEAYRWNGKYVYYCPVGLVFTASSVSDDRGQLCGSLVAGPLVMGALQDTLDELPVPDLREAVSTVPVRPTAQVNHLSALLAAAAAYAAGIPHSHAGGFVYEQEKLLNTLYELREKQETAVAPYPIACEKQLLTLIVTRDKSGAQALLNQLLGHIYFSSKGDLDAIKARVVELVVLLSRAIIDAGADIQEVFLFNTNYIHDIEQFESTDELSVWLTGIMNRFINYTFNFAQIKHSDVVYKVMEYVKANYNKKLSLEEIARHVYFSRSYLSSLFKNETGSSLFAYINRVRVEKSKVLLLDESISLLDVAALCGFEDQSYFTKVFKKLVGVSPKRYRSSRGQLEVSTAT